MIYHLVWWFVLAQCGALWTAESAACSASVRVERGLKQQGFHKEVETSISLQSNVCFLSVVEEIPADFYLDKYQLGNLQEKHGLIESQFAKTAHYSFSLQPERIDVESPSFVTDFTLDLPTLTIFHQNISFLSQHENWTLRWKFPFHIRYHEPNFGADYIDVRHYNNFSLIIETCNNEYSRICVNESDFELIHIPVGRREHKTAISLITFVVTCFAAAHVGTALKRS